MNIYLRRIESSDMYNSDIFNMLNLMPKEENGFMNPGFGITWEDFPDFISKSLREITNPDTSKGYGKILLNKTLQEIKKIGVDKVLITCDEPNNSSRKVIESNNGKLEEIVDNECRYWIEVGLDRY